MPLNVVGSGEASDPALWPSAGFQSISSDYFKTFGISLLQGRSFNDQDTATSVRVAVVNEEFVRRRLKALDPLKQRLLIQQIIPGAPQLGPWVEWQIVGVFHDVRDGDFRDPDPEVDVPIAQSPTPYMSIGVRTTRDPAAISKTVAAAVHAVDPQVALAHVRTMEQIKDESLAEDRFSVVLFASFAGAGLPLAAVGIYGLMAYTVSQRTSELGLRLALGSGKGHVIALIMKEASMLAVIGLAAGLVGALLVGRTMQSTLYGVGKMDVSVILLVAGILFSTALIASLIPAMRGASIDPMEALRTE
jgi:putative ABC transport system permease protein